MPEMPSWITAKPLLALALGGLTLFSAPQGARGEDDRFASSRETAKTSAARLLAGEAGPTGSYLAGVEIDLAPKTVTYWRQPGEAGEPPAFDFSRSKNLAKVEALYPAPKHIEEAGSLVAGYDAKVIFPLRVAAQNAGAPVTLDLELHYAACQTLCLPARARLTLALPQNGASPYAGAVKEALALVPRRLDADEARMRFKIARRDGEPARWRVNYLGPGKAQDVFAEAPDPLFLDVAPAPDRDGFDLTLSTNGATPPASGVEATLTLVTDQGAVEAPVTLK